MAVRMAARAALGAIALSTAIATSAFGYQNPVAYGGAGGGGGPHGAGTGHVGLGGNVTGTGHKKTSSSNVLNNVGGGGKPGHGGRGGSTVVFNK